MTFSKATTSTKRRKVKLRKASPRKPPPKPRAQTKPQPGTSSDRWVDVTSDEDGETFDYAGQSTGSASAQVNSASSTSLTDALATYAANRKSTLGQGDGHVREALALLTKSAPARLDQARKETNSGMRPKA
ncbi:hypothetical protein HGRIS_010484 [Hohenbuehelia grisea]|uniref:Uncharacterized protein n=1 Tax=Hohenbuehelia grisea TaxID=104357 RepID=A0ABR3IZM0_9AGAR